MKFTSKNRNYDLRVCKKCGCEYTEEQADSGFETYWDGFAGIGGVDHWERCPECGCEDFVYKDYTQEDAELKEAFETLIKENFTPEQIRALNEIYDGSYICEDVVFGEE